MLAICGAGFLFWWSRQKAVAIFSLIAILMMTMTPSLTLYAHSGQSHRSHMARIEAVFATARPAKRAELNGNWVLVTDVYTQRFQTGQSGPDHVLANEEGIRNADVARQLKKLYSGAPSQLYWKLTFRQLDSRVHVVTHSAFAPGATSQMLTSTRMAISNLRPISVRKATLLINVVWKAQLASCACSIAVARAWCSEGSPNRSPSLIASYDNA